MEAEHLPVLRPRHPGRGPQPGLSTGQGPPRTGRGLAARRWSTASRPAGTSSLPTWLARRCEPTSRTVPAVVIAHGYPSDVTAAAVAASAMPELADRIAAEMGWLAMAVAFRGCGGSEGSFSLGGLAGRPASGRRPPARPFGGGGRVAGRVRHRRGAGALRRRRRSRRAGRGRPRSARRLRRLGVASQAPARARTGGRHDRRSQLSPRSRRLGARAQGAASRDLRAAAVAAPAAGDARERRRPRPRLRRSGPGRRPRVGRAPHHDGGRPPAPPRPSRRRHPARVAGPADPPVAPARRERPRRPRGPRPPSAPPAPRRRAPPRPSGRAGPPVRRSSLRGPRGGRRGRRGRWRC